MNGLQDTKKTARLRGPAVLASVSAGAFLLLGASLFRAGAETSPPVAAAAPPRRIIYAVNVASDGVPPPTWTPTPTPSPTPTPLPRPRPASPQGVRIWSNGDSTSYFMTVGIYGLFLGGGGVPVADAEYKISSGLNNTGFFDWYSYADAQMATYRPDVAVFMIGANDAHVGMDLAAYHDRVGSLMDHFYAPGRLVVWVGQPAMGRPDLAAAVPPMNRVFRDEAAKRPWVLYVDAWALTAGSDGGFSYYLRDSDGTQVLARADDGVHFSPAGGRILARGVFDAIFRR